MSAEEEVIINTLLVGAREFVAGVQAEVGVLRELGVATGIVGKEMESTGTKTFIANQALFTTRRVAYAGTLALLGAGAAALKLGWNYANAMQQSRVALAPVFKDTQALNNELEHLFKFSSFTPFQFKDITVAFRQLYASLKGAPGILNPLKEANDTIKSLTDSLSFAGKTSPQALQRVSLAIQHMAYQGHLTGYAINQLSRDGLPMLRILNQELGLTGDQIHSIGALNVPVQTVLDAINKFVQTTPGFANAAFRQATMTLHGAFTTFKDLLSQAVAGGGGSLFGGLTHFFQDVDKALQPMLKDNKPVTITNFIVAIDQVLSPKTHLVLDFFSFLQGAIHGVELYFKALTTVIDIVLFPLQKLSGGGHGAQLAFHALGYTMGVVLALMLVFKTYAYAAAAAEVLWTGVMWAGYLATRAYVLAMTAWDFIILITSSELGILSAIAAAFGFEVEWLGLGTWLVTAATTAWAGILGILGLELEWVSAEVFGLRLLSLLLGAAIWVVEVAVYAFTLSLDLLAGTFAALDLLLGPVGWIALAIVGLVLLYQHSATFRRIVNDVFDFIKKHWMLLTAILFGPFEIAAVYAYRNLNAIKKDVEAVFTYIGNKADWLKNKLKDLWDHVPGHGTIAKIAKGAWGAATSLIPHFADGGTMSHSGFALVGERGPELLSLPAGATITPLQGDGSFASLSGALSGLIIKVYPQDIYLDRLKVATVMATATTDLEARQ